MTKGSRTTSGRQNDSYCLVVWVENPKKVLGQTRIDSYVVALRVPHLAPHGLRRSLPLPSLLYFRLFLEVAETKYLNTKSYAAINNSHLPLHVMSLIHKKEGDDIIKALLYSLYTHISHIKRSILSYLRGLSRSMRTY
jgi:hypothetical protein